MKTINSFVFFSLVYFLPFQLISQEAPDKRNVWSGGQNGYVVTGDLSILKNEKTFNVVIVPGIKKMGAKEEPDSIYIPNRVKELNEKKAGKGDKWLEEWEAAQKNFKQAFIDGFNVKAQKKGVNIGSNDAQANYTFILYTRNLMEFWSAMYLILDMDVVKTSDPSTRIISIRFPVNNSSKATKAYKDLNERAYYWAGYLFGKYFAKAAYK